MAARSMSERLLDLIVLMVDHPEGLALTEMARSLDIPKSATHRILATLVGRGFVEQPEGRDVYRLGMKLPALGFRLVAKTRILDICQPVLERLAVETGELVRMTLADNNSLTWVAKAQGAQWGLRYDPDMGSPVVLHATASGRAWLLTLGDGEAQAIVAAQGFKTPERFGRAKITNPEQLSSELARTAARGYGLAVEEGELGTSAVAMALPSEPGFAAPGTISVAGPVARMSAERLERIVPMLARAVAELGELWPIVHSRMAQGEIA
jgi:IclR family acetate operon transcriptional repressor